MECFSTPATPNNYTHKHMFVDANAFALYTLQYKSLEGYNFNTDTVCTSTGHNIKTGACCV